MKPLVVDPDALADLAEAQDWYDERQEGLGQELHDEVATALSRIRSDPGIGARYRDTAFRFYKVKRFPYVIYYRDLPERIWVAAIAHGRRRPNYWRKRKPSNPESTRKTGDSGKVRKSGVAAQRLLPLSYGAEGISQGWFADKGVFSCL